jgi:hypothetical protein
MRHPQLLRSRNRKEGSDVEYVDLGNRPLVFDVFGPFAIKFKRGKNGKPGTSVICAPLCFDHHANLLTDTDDVSVDGQSKQAKSNYVHRFVEGHAPTGAPTFSPPREGNIFRVKSKSEHFPYEINPENVAKFCHVVFEVPMPNRIEALRPEPSWVHRNGSEFWVIDRDTKPWSKYAAHADPNNLVNSNRGRGLRLIYDECKTPPDFYLPLASGPRQVGLIAATRGFPLGKRDLIPAYYGITLRFAASHATGDGVDDAHGCFQTMRGMLDKYLGTNYFSQWRADFAQSDINLPVSSIGGPRPHDCGAMVLVMQDWDDPKLL